MPATFPIIESKHNARVKRLRAALKANESVDGLVALEGEHLLLEALRSGLELATVFVRAGREGLLRKLPLDWSAQTVVLGEDVFLSATATDNPQGIAALVRPPKFVREDLLGTKTPPEECANAGALVLVAAGVQDPGNLGTLIRSAEAFGAAGVLALPGTVSAWNQKALRASAGSTFRLPVVAGTIDDLRWLGSNGVELLAATMDGGATASEIDLQGAVALIIGNEGAGLSSELLALADRHITIPCPGPVESLNAAVAGSLLLYEAARQRSTSCATIRRESTASASATASASNNLK